MRAFTRCLTLPLAFAVMVAFASAARADDPLVTPERPVMYFGFDPDPLSLALCGNGFLRNPPSPNPLWTLDTQGARSTGSRITGFTSATTQNAWLCVTVHKLGAPYGTYGVAFRYQALPEDPPSQIVAHVVWYPGTDGKIFVTEQ